MVLDVDGQVLLAGLERHAFRHGPRGENAVALEAKVVVEPACVVPLDDEDRSLRLAALAAKWLGRLLAIALAFVVRELLAHAAFPILKSYACRLHNEYMAGISLWTVWTASVPETSKTV